MLLVQLVFNCIIALGRYLIVKSAAEMIGTFPNLQSSSISLICIYIEFTLDYSSHINFPTTPSCRKRPRADDARSVP